MPISVLIQSEESACTLSSVATTVTTLLYYKESYKKVKTKLIRQSGLNEKVYSILLLPFAFSFPSILHYFWVNVNAIMLHCSCGTVCVSCVCLRTPTY
jgi:hypothetical protein